MFDAPAQRLAIDFKPFPDAFVEIEGFAHAATTERSIDLPDLRDIVPISRDNSGLQKQIQKGYRSTWKGKSFRQNILRL
jgi:hypothetical protein